MKEILFSGSYFYDLYVSRISSFPLYIVISLLFALFCILVIIQLCVYVSISRTKEYLQDKRDANLKDKIIGMLANVLVFDDNTETSSVVFHFLPRFSKLPVYRNSIRKILISELVKSNSSFSGRSAQVLKEIYMRLKLDSRARKNLMSRNLDKKIESIRELTEMGVSDECEKILQYTNHPNPQLRLEAQTAYIKLCVENPFRFLDTVEEELLDWHQIILFEVITKTETMARPRFAYWLNSGNDSVVSFCLKLIQYYQQFDAVQNLIYLINHYNLKIRASAIEILGKMEAEIAESHLIAAYPVQPLKIKVQILNALGLISSGRSLSFLDTQARIKEHVIRVAALRAIKAHRQEGSELLSSLFSESFAQDQNIIKHVLEERMKY